MKFSAATAAFLLWVVGSTVALAGALEEEDAHRQLGWTHGGNFVCLEKKIGFDTDKNGNANSAGDRANLISWPLEMTIKTLDLSNRPPMLFDAANPTGGDNDLLRPSEGLVLIISEDNDASDPDDNAGGGTIVFEFGTPVKIKDMGLLDIEESYGTVKVYDSNGVLILNQYLPTTADGGYTRKTLEVEDVKKMEVKLKGSGAITDVVFCVDPGVFGDPHFTTWSGAHFDYHGVCDLLFVESPANNLAVHLRTTEKFHYSYVSSAAIKLNDDVFEFASWGQVIWNGMYVDWDTDLPETIGGHKLTVEVSNRKTHTYMIDFGDGSGIEVKSFKDMVAVRLIGNNVDFLDSRGIMGSPLDGRKLGRDGRVITDDNAFGQEWQILADEPKLFETARHPQAPHPCVIPSAEAYTENHRLGAKLARAKAEEACANWKMNKEACIADVMLTGDVEMAAAFYA